MNKGIKETKSDTKKNKNVSKIATRIIREKKRSPSRGKDRSSSMNSLVVCEKAESPKKVVQKEAKSKMVGGSSLENICDFRKSVNSSGCSPPKDQEKKQSSETSAIETTEQIKNQESKSNRKQKILHELIAREGSIEKLLQIKKNAKTVYNIEGMSPSEIRESLARVDEKTAKPFSFLKDIIDDREEDKHKMTRDAKDQELNPTDIDLQLSSLVRRVELNRTLLERANQRVKDINFLAERNKVISIRNMKYDEDSFLKIKDEGVISKEPVAPTDLTAVSHPAVEELQKTMSSTIEMLAYVHQMSSGDLASGKIPTELTDYLNSRENP